MSNPLNVVVFFDIGNTLASVRVSPALDRIESLIAFPDVPPILEDLKSSGVRLGILSNRGNVPEANVNEALKSAGLLRFFDANLIQYGPKDTPRLFEQATARAGNNSGDNADASRSVLLFVGEDANERAQALAADFLVAPHPLLAKQVLSGSGPLRYLRVHIPPAQAETDWRATLRALPFVPLHISAATAEPLSIAVYGMADSSTAAKLDDLGFWVDRLGAEDEPLASDLYILRDDEQIDSGFLAPIGSSFAFFRGSRAAGRVLTSTAQGLFVAIPAGRSVESYHFPTARHGHNLKLVASTALLESMEAEVNPRIAETTAFFAPQGAMADATETLAQPLDVEEQKAIKKYVTSRLVTRDVQRYSGALPASSTPLMNSRHIHHAGNAAAVTALVDELTRIGAGSFRVQRHRFTHEGSSYDNIEATLPPSGRDGIILITAHLDSTGARQPGYRASLDPAPGADDDASGVAGVLAAARAVAALTSLAVSRREIRFVLFNAEEHGLVGSRAYAREQALLRAKIVAVFQMDMIGYDVVPARTFELHCGFTPSVSVQTRSSRLADLIAALVPVVSPTLPAPQRYNGIGSAGGGPDPAESRSDHYSFQIEGYAACLASEDFFAGPGPTAPAPEPNPKYHMPTDSVVNASYAAAIARAVIAAAWVSATR